MPLNIFLTGFMGCGKSRLAAVLAQKLGWQQADTDAVFALENGLSAGEFIRQHGEEEFRRREQRVLRQLAEEREFTVIATGGGVPTWPGNRQIMAAGGVTLFLDVPLEVIEARLSAAESAGRPLWNGADALARRQRYDARQPFYRQAEYRIVNNGDKEPEDVTAEFRTLAAEWLRKAPLKSRGFKKLQQEVARACGEYELLQPDDRILVGLSGGEDSLLLMHLLTALQKRLPFKVTIIPATVDMQLPGFDLPQLQRYCRDCGWDLQVVTVPNGEGIFQRNGVDERPCPVCSRLRRGKLHGLLQELHCNKLALGQHLTDLCTSFLMSVFRGGGIKTMGPNVPADGGNARLIRPLWSVTKSQIHQVAVPFDFPKIRSCPYEESLRQDGDRYYIEELIRNLEKEGRFPDLQAAMRKSMGDIRLGHLLDKKHLPQ